MNLQQPSAIPPAARRSFSRRMLGQLGIGGIAATLLTSSIGPARARQDSSMPPGSTGITPQPLGSGQPSVAPGYAMGLVRLTYEPGGTLNAHTHPGTSILYIESGTLTYTLIDGTATLTRASTGPLTPGAALAAEPVSPGDVELQTGDSLFEDADVIHTARNDGNEPAVVLIANLLTAGAPVSTFLEATPTP
jgi:quercetin dioxygenase-like cupin family protein